MSPDGRNSKNMIRQPDYPWSAA